MIDNKKHIQDEQLKETDEAVASVENTRRKLVTKIAAGAFAIPAVLMSLSSTPAHAS